MNTVLRIGKGVLLAWGGFSLLCVLLFLGLMAYAMWNGNRDQTDHATPHDLSGILQQCHVTEGQVEKIPHSYRSSRSLTGDHLDAYAIKVSGLNSDTLKSTSSSSNKTWYRGDQLPEMVKAAVKSVNVYTGNEAPWFPEASNLMTSDVYVLPGLGSFKGIQQYAGELTFVRPSDGMVFYINWKT